MTDYAELIKDLRESAEWADRLAVLMGRDVGDSKAPLMRNAADAIEELLAESADLNGQVKRSQEEIRKLDKLLAAVPKWISVEERLPEENKNYLTYGVFLPLGVKAMDMNRFDGTKWLTSADVEITHWMPLPAPPKEVQDG